MVQKSGDHQLRLLVYPPLFTSTTGLNNIPGGDRRISEQSTVLLQSVALKAGVKRGKYPQWVGNHIAI